MKWRPFNWPALLYGAASVALGFAVARLLRDHASAFCSTGETAGICLRNSLAAIGPILVGLATLVFMRRQVKISATQNEILQWQSRFDLIEQFQNKLSAIDAEVGEILASLAQLEEKGGPDVATVRTRFLQGRSPGLLFASPNPQLGAALQDLINALNSIPPRGHPIDAALDSARRLRVLVQSDALIHKARLEEVCEGNMGKPMPRFQRDALDAWLKANPGMSYHAASP